MKDWGPRGYGKCNRKHSAGHERKLKAGKAENAGLLEPALLVEMRDAINPIRSKTEDGHILYSAGLVLSVA